jgi:hypothetical protein
MGLGLFGFGTGEDKNKVGVDELPGEMTPTPSEMSKMPTTCLFDIYFY